MKVCVADACQGSGVGMLRLQAPPVLWKCDMHIQPSQNDKTASGAATTVRAFSKSSHAMIHHASMCVPDPAAAAQGLAELLAADLLRALSPPFPAGAWLVALRD